MSLFIIAFATPSFGYLYLTHILPFIKNSTATLKYHLGIIKFLYFHPKRNLTILLTTFVALVFYSIFSDTFITASSDTFTNKPNVLIIGIDSLRPSEVGLDSSVEESLMPYTHTFLQNSKVFNTAYTPLARTFPAWNSILTGTYPSKHKAYFNLINPTEHDNQITSLASMFRNRGYNTVYATDEKRFSNIDETFGFDTIIGPPIGLEDFLLGKFNDLPLNNILSNTFIGKFFFPFSYANRAASVTYNPASFIDLLQQGISANSPRPSFINIHLCLPHWPYIWSTLDKNNTKHLTTYAKYKLCLKEVDKQLSKIISIFSSNGLLDNSIVVLLSDHGESFAETTSKYQNDLDRTDPFHNRQISGHGTDVLNRSQHQVLLAMRSFGNPQITPGISQQHASLIDIAPTLYSMFNLGTVQTLFDGISLIPWLTENNAKYIKRHFFVESGFNVPAIQANVPDEKKALFQGIDHYHISRNGRVTLKDSSIQLLLKNKQFAIYSDSVTLALLPNNNSSTLSNVLVDHTTNTTYRKYSSNWTKHSELYDALRSHFSTLITE